MDQNLIFDEYLRKNDYSFHWCGLHLRNRKNYNVKKARWLYWFNFVVLDLAVIGAAVWIVKGVARGEGLVVLTHTAPSTTLAFLCNVRSLSIMWYHDYVDKLVFKLRELETKADLNNNVNKTLVEGPIKFLHFVLKVSRVVNWFLIVAFPLMPLSISAYNYFVLDKVELLLPFLIEYPFDPYDIKVYPYVMVYNVYAEMISLFWILASESFYYVCCTFLEVQFILLQQEILLIIPIRSGNRSGRQNEDEEYQTKLTKFVKWHQELLEVVLLIETVYSKSTLFNFASISVIICLAGFNLTTNNDVALAVTYVTLLCLTLMQIFFFCYYGDIIMRSNQKVSDAVYNCIWYSTSVRNAKMLHYLQIRTQKPCKFTAYGFADVNLNAFSQVMKTSWSYFALLRTINK